MQETRVVRRVSNQRAGGVDVQQEEVSSGQVVDSQEYTLAKTAQIIWFIAHFIAIILALRFVFYLLGANPTGVVDLVYNLSSLFVIPFRGIFPSAVAGEFFFDSAALLGIVMYYLITFLLIKLLTLFSRNTAT